MAVGMRMRMYIGRERQGIGGKRLDWRREPCGPERRRQHVASCAMANI
jgi:hypothetical protein